MNGVIPTVRHMLLCDDAEAQQDHPQAEIKPPSSKNAPILTVEADEMTEFIVRAIPASDLAAKTGKT